MFFCLLAISTQLLTFTPNLVVMRHGEGEHNVQGVFSGLTKEEGGVDHQLTDEGRSEVSKTAERLLERGINRETVSLMLVSPMQRTRETAQILIDRGVCSHEAMIIDPRIREYLFGEWEGQAKQGTFSSWAEEVDACIQVGGETLQEIFKRTQSAIDFVKGQAFEKKHVILVTHGAIASTILNFYGEPTNIHTAEARILSLEEIAKLAFKNW